MFALVRRYSANLGEGLLLTCLQEIRAAFQLQYFSPRPRVNEGQPSGLIVFLWHLAAALCAPGALQNGISERVGATPCDLGAISLCLGN